MNICDLLLRIAWNNIEYVNTYSFDTKEKLILATSTEAPCKLDCKSKSQSFPSFTFTYKHLKERWDPCWFVTFLMGSVCLCVTKKKFVGEMILSGGKNIWSGEKSFFQVEQLFCQVGK